MTGNSLEIILPSHSGNIVVAYGNSFGMVKKNNIGKSATKHPQVDEGSTTIPNGSTPEANGGKGEQLQS